MRRVQIGFDINQKLKVLSGNLLNKLRRLKVFDSTCLQGLSQAQSSYQQDIHYLLSPSPLSHKKGTNKVISLLGIAAAMTEGFIGQWYEFTLREMKTDHDGSYL